MRNNNNWFWGLFFICTGGVLIASQMGYFSGIGVLTLVLTVLLIPVLIKSILNLNWGGILFPLAFLLIMYKVPLGVPLLSTWTILLAALFGTIGLSMIFGSSSNKYFIGAHKTYYDEESRRNMGGEEHMEGYYEEYVNEENMNVGYEEDDIVNVKASFSGTTKYVNSKNFRKAYLETSFGALQVFFDNASLSPEGAEIYLNANFGGVELFIPKEWNVENRLNVTLAGVEEKNRAYASGGPKVILSGNVSFAGVEIKYI